MSDPGLEKRMSDELDDALRRLNAAQVECTAASRTARTADAARNEIAAEAQRLRMALFALRGESDKNFGDANKANHERGVELKRGSDV